MIRALTASTSLALLFAACATSPRTAVDPSPQPQPQTQPAMATPAAAAAPTSGAFDPVGNYTFSVNIQNNTVPGSMVITRTPDGALGGHMSSDQGSLTFNSISVEGRTVTATGVLDGGPAITFRMEFTGDDFAGSLNMQGSEGTIHGTRRKN